MSKPSNLWFYEQSIQYIDIEGDLDFGVDTYASVLIDKKLAQEFVFSWQFT